MGTVSERFSQMSPSIWCLFESRKSCFKRRDACRKKKPTFQQRLQVLDPVVVAMRVVHAARQQHGVEPFKLGRLGHLATLVGHDEPYVGLDAEARLVLVAGGLEVPVEVLSVRALPLLGLGVWLIRLEYHHAHDRRRALALASVLCRRSVGVVCRHDWMWLDVAGCEMGLEEMSQKGSVIRVGGGGF